MYSLAPPARKLLSPTSWSNSEETGLAADFGPALVWIWPRIGPLSETAHLWSHPRGGRPERDVAVKCGWTSDTFISLLGLARDTVSLGHLHIDNYIITAADKLKGRSLN